MPSAASIASWPSAVAPPWLPIAGTTNGSAPSSRSPAIVAAQQLDPAGEAAAAGADGDRHPGVDGAGEPATTSSRAAASTSATGSAVGHASSTSVSGGTVIAGSIGSVDAGAQLLPTHSPERTAYSAVDVRGVPMERFWRRLGRWLGTHRLAALGILVAVTVLLGHRRPQIEFATGQDSYLNPDSQIAIDNVASSRSSSAARP